jgi:medium-chain acyl-[acyl-carrier-protein] hydrolase
LCCYYFFFFKKPKHTTKQSQSSLPESIEYVAVQLPGRSTRIEEEPLPKFEDIVQNVTDAMVDFVTGNNLPYAIYGHSFGMCKELQKRQLTLPQHLCFSGRGGPCGS